MYFVQSTLPFKALNKSVEFVLNVYITNTRTKQIQ